MTAVVFSNVACLCGATLICCSFTSLFGVCVHSARLAYRCTLSTLVQIEQAAFARPPPTPAVAAAPSGSSPDAIPTATVVPKIAPLSQDGGSDSPALIAGSAAGATWKSTATLSATAHTFAPSAEGHAAHGTAASVGEDSPFLRLYHRLEENCLSQQHIMQAAAAPVSPARPGEPALDADVMAARGATRKSLQFAGDESELPPGSQPDPDVLQSAQRVLCALEGAAVRVGTAAVGGQPISPAVIAQGDDSAAEDEAFLQVCR